MTELELETKVLCSSCSSRCHTLGGGKVLGESRAIGTVGGGMKTVLVTGLGG